MRASARGFRKGCNWRGWRQIIGSIGEAPESAKDQVKHYSDNAVKYEKDRAKIEEEAKDFEKERDVKGKEALRLDPKNEPATRSCRLSRSPGDTPRLVPEPAASTMRALPRPRP